MRRITVVLLLALSVPIPVPGRQTESLPVIYLGRSAKAWGEDLKRPDPETRRAAAFALSKCDRTVAAPYAGDLIRALGDADPGVREAAAVALGVLGGAAADDALLPLLRRLGGDDDPAARRAAAWALGQLGPNHAAAAVPQLQRALADADPRVRQNAAGALGAIGGEAALQALPALIPLLDDPDVLVRRDTAVALGALGPRAAPAVDALTRALADGDPVVPPNAAWALGKLGKAAEPAVGGLLRALERRDEGLRTNALDSLVQIGVNVDRSLPRFQKAMGLLRQMLKDPDPQVREKTAALLVNLGEIASPCLPELVAALRDQEAPVRKAAALALSKMIHKCEAEEAARAVPALLRALEQDPEQEVRLRIAWVFLDIPADLRRTPEALDVMVRVSRQDRVPIVRYETARGAARHFGAEARAVVPTLIQHLKSPTTHIVSNSVAKVNSAGAEGGGQATLEDEAGKDGRVLPAAALGLLGDAAGPEARKALEEAANDPSPELRIAAKQALRNFRK